MNEQAIFEAALEIDNPAKRAAFIEKACAGNVELRDRVDSLLKSHESAGSFLEVPAVPAPKADTARPVDRTMDFAPKVDTGAEEEKEEDREVALSFLQPSTKPGSLGVLGHYEILQILGQGGFGIVFKAFDEKLHRLVAIKVMSPQLAATSPPRKRFQREARAAAAIKHENIVQVYSVEDQPLPYLVMEYIDGQTLAEKLDGIGPLEKTEVLHLARQIASGLAAAHEKGLIHRDIKPGNILLEAGAEQKVKITDFGLARVADDASMTRTGTIAGTPLYMAPEQAMGKTLDHRADLFSFGSVLYQMTSGRAPFRAPTTIAVLRRVAEDTPRPLRDILPEIPTWLAAIVDKLLKKSPDERYQSAREVADLLGRCQTEWQQTGQVTCVPEEKSPPQPPATDYFELKPKQRPSIVQAGPRFRFGVWMAALVICAAITAVVVNQFFINGEENISSSFSDTNNKGGNSTSKTAWDGWPADAPSPAIAPFDAAQAKRHQEEWAAYLKVPVEYTNSIGMKFRLIPPGEFLMGSSAVEKELPQLAAADNQEWQDIIQSESPQHRVMLRQPFYLGIHEVTQSQFQAISETNPAHFTSLAEGTDADAAKETARFPVESVSRNDAVKFCIALAEHEKLKPYYSQAGETFTHGQGAGYRLPSEAQWEFAARAGTTTRFWCGDRDSDLSRTDRTGINSGGRPHSVGELPPNPFGLFDVHGNVWEWTQDGWDPSSYHSFVDRPASDPFVPFATSATRVNRGGSFGDHPQRCRAADRAAHPPWTRSRNIGYRAALSVDAVRTSLKLIGPEATTSPTRSSPTLGQFALDTVPDRRAAEWALSVGGSIVIQQQDQLRAI